MKAVEIVILAEKLMKTMSEADIRMTDWQFLDLYREAEAMTRRGEKKAYVVAFLANRYGLSEATVWRILRRMRRSVGEGE